MKYSDWYRAERKAEKAYKAACARGAARLNNPGTRLAQCVRACDRAYLAWLAVREALGNVTEWDDFVR